ncbi:MAG: hypothetical protein N2C14_25770 [Planctomycetales bacterium]
MKHLLWSVAASAALLVLTETAVEREIRGVARTALRGVVKISKVMRRVSGVGGSVRRAQ